MHLLLLSSLAFGQSNYGSKNGKVSFFSSTPLEDIRAVSEKLAAVLLAKNQEIAFQVPIRSFTFAKGLMQEHFNENYMESDKFPYAKFRGKIVQPVDLSRNGEYTVSAQGTLTVHGVDRHRNIPGKLLVQDGKVRIVADFDVACADHRIKIPTLVIKKVAEVINVKVDATLSPLK